MKRILALVCTLALIFSLTACGVQETLSELTPQTAVLGYCRAMQQMDAEGMKAGLVGDAAEDSLTTDDIPEEAQFLLEQIRVWAKDTTMKVIDTKTEGNTATVTVYFTYKDASPVMTETLKDYLTQAFSAAFSDGEVSDTLLEEIFSEKAQTAVLEETSSTVTFTCVKTDDGWKISEIPSELYDVVTCNMTYGLGSLADALG